MKDDKKLELLLERFYNRYNKYNTKVLEAMGEIIKKFDGVTPSVAHKIAQELKYGKDLDELVKELSQITNTSIEDVYESFDIIAKENNDFAKIYAEAKGKDFIEYENNKQLQKLVKAIEKETTGNLINITNTRAIGFVLKKGDKTIFKPLKKVYRDLIDEAVYNVSKGVIDYQSAMRNTITQLADSGVRIHENKIQYKSGYSRRIDSSVRQSILTGVRQVNIDVQEQVGKQYGADGVEISAHYPCAEDHLFIQGKQYSKKEFEKLNDSLDRPIGEYNCRHFVFSIILGVNLPSYTKKQLSQMEKYSHEKVIYERKIYTKYEATQVQRQLETEIRKQKDRQIIARSSGDSKGIKDAQNKISLLTSKYNDFSKKANLDIYKNRLTVNGYRRVAV